MLFRKLVLSALVLSPAVASAQTLSLQDYILQVEEKNESYVATKKRSKAFEMRGDEWKLLIRPNLIGGAEYNRDQRLTGAPVFQGRETRIQSYFLGIQQNTTFGLDATLSYRYVDTQIFGVDRQFFPQPEFIIASPVLELNQSLWRNFFGRGTRAQLEALEAQNKSDRLREEFLLANLRSQAESTYWNLAVARKMVTAAQDNLTRAERIHSWYSKRSNMRLSDNSERYQGDAILAERKLDLRRAIDQEKTAALNFNLARGANEVEVPEKLDELKYEKIMSMQAPEITEDRKDVQAAQQAAVASRARAEVEAQNLKPDVQLYAQLSLNGRDPRARTTIDQSFSSAYPMNIVGVRLNVPLAMGITSDAQQAFRMLADSEQLAYNRIHQTTAQNLTNLLRRFEEAKSQLKLAIDLEEAQKKKADFEKQRRSRGLSTAYQVIMFEQEYTGAQINRLNLEAEILNLYAELKTFGGSK